MSDRRVLGVDFSASRREAGRKTWLAAGVVADGPLSIDTCVPVSDALGVAPDRETTLPALVDHVASLDAAVVGIDCSLGLPADVLDAAGVDSWDALVRGFPTSLVGDSRAVDDVDTATGDGVPTTADEFAAVCERLTPGDGYATRLTDDRHGALPPAHFFVKYQTFHGLRDVLRPLVERDAVRVVPTGTTSAPTDGGDVDTDAGRDASRSTLVEVYPAATLSRLALPNEGYKTDDDAGRMRRERILDGVETVADVSSTARRAAASDPNGDGLDAILSCVAAARTVRPASDGGGSDPPWPADDRVFREGWIHD